MTEGERQIIDRELFCRCGECEAFISEILRMERLMCPRGKSELTRRRNRIKRAALREARRDYWRDRQRTRSP